MKTIPCKKIKPIKTTKLVVFFCSYFTLLKDCKTVDFSSKNHSKKLLPSWQKSIFRLPNFAANQIVIDMEVITIEAKAYKEIVGKLDEIARYVKKHSESQHECWIDNHDVCKYLNVSTRTLQRLRSQKLISFSIIRGKTYYQLSEIERMLNENLIKSNPNGFQELLDNYYKNDK